MQYPIKKNSLEVYLLVPVKLLMLHPVQNTCFFIQKGKFAVVVVVQTLANYGKRH